MVKKQLALVATALSAAVVLAAGCNQLLDHHERQAVACSVPSDTRISLGDDERVRSCERHTSCRDTLHVQVGNDCSGFECDGETLECKSGSRCQVNSTSTDCCFDAGTQLDPRTCPRYVACPGGVLVDLSSYGESGFWGPSNARGSTSFYAEVGEPDFTITRTHNDEMPGAVLHVAFDTHGGRYSGIVFGFNDYCVKAGRSSKGIKLDLVTHVLQGNASLSLLPQTNKKYPIEPEHNKGACKYNTCDSKWNDCRFSSATFSEKYRSGSGWAFDWDAFTPVGTNVRDDFEDIVAIAIQVDCGGPCAGSFDLGNITLISPDPEEVGAGGAGCTP